VDFLQTFILKRVLFISKFYLEKHMKYRGEYQQVPKQAFIVKVPWPSAATLGFTSFIR